MSSASETHPDREIQEDVMNVPFIAWLAAVSTILIAVSVLLLIGVYHLTKQREVAKRQAEATLRIDELEANRLVDREVITSGEVYVSEIENMGTVDRKYHLPVERGIQAVLEQNKK